MQISFQFEEFFWQKFKIRIWRIWDFLTFTITFISFRKLKAAQSTFEHSDFFQDFLRTWTRIFDKKENKEAISKIICLGLGNFAQNPHSVSAQIASKFQLSFLLALLKTFSVQGHVFDPVLTKCEKEILTALGFETPEENLEGRYQVEEDQDKYTLFYLPHCPKQLTNNILWANWESLQNCVIIGNSFNCCVLNLSKRQLESVSYLRQASKFVKGNFSLRIDQISVKGTGKKCPAITQPLQLF